jgi:hypothetical protein
MTAGIVTAKMLCGLYGRLMKPSAICAGMQSAPAEMKMALLATYVPATPPVRLGPLGFLLSR